MASNLIVTENQKPGTPKTYWDASHSDQIEGFAADISYDIGQTVELKINVNGNATDTLPYTVEIFRLGYYGGDGATLVATINNADGTVQPDPITDTRGLVDAGNWSVTDSWTIPQDAVSGVYLARIQRLDGNGDPIDGATNQIPFIVRDDTPASGVKSDIVLQTSDTTWHAYNGWGGNNGQLAGNFYGDLSGTIDHPDVPSPGLGAQDRAYAVSYNRPFVTRDGGGAAAGPQDYLFGADFAAIFWLEKNGYDVSYISGVDADRLGAGALIGHKAYVSVGHDEYWSGPQRDNVEAARDAGVNLLFWSGNEVYWRTRYEASIDGNDTPYRTLASYKETWANGNPGAAPADYANIDPSNEWTGTWRDLRFVTSVDINGVNIAVGAEPENALTGQLFGPDGTGQFGGALDVPAEFAQLRVWRDTGISAAGATDIAPGLIGYEWNTVPEDQFRPAGLIKLSESVIPWNGILVDQGNQVQPGVATHNLSLYRAESGALVFGSGTVFWSWGLSDQHDSSPYGANIESEIIQQFTVNLLADMGIQPANDPLVDAILLAQGLIRATASTDLTAPTTTAGILGGLTTVEEGQLVTITGTATDDDGNALTDDGLVALVEVSIDGGSTWRVANGTSNWTFTWTAQSPGDHTILARSIDDSLNVQTAGLASNMITVTASPASRLFSDTDVPVNPSAVDSAVELGVKFFSSSNGFITDLLFYKSPLETGTHEGHLWAADGTLLATFEFENETASGWQTATLDTPLAITANTTYVASYHANNSYAITTGFFALPHTSGSLTAPSSAESGGNGVFTYGAASAFPTSSFDASNYWVDVVFTLFTGVNEAPVIDGGETASFTINENAVTVATILAIDPNAGQSPGYSIVLPDGLNGAGADGAFFSIDPITGSLSFAAAPDFELPLDADGNNTYLVTVRASDSFDPSLFDEQLVTVTVEDQSSEPGQGSFAGHTVLAEYIFGATADTLFPSAGASQSFVVDTTPGAIEVPNIPFPDTVAIGNGVFGLASIDLDTATIRVEFPLDPSLFSGSINFAGPGTHPFNGIRITDANGQLPAILSATIADQAGFTIALDATNVIVSSEGLFLNVNAPGAVVANGRLVDVDGVAPGAQPSFVLLSVDLNDNPEFTSNGGGAGANVDVVENTTLVALLTALDPDNVPVVQQSLTFSLVGGEDQGLFEILNGNELHFVSAPDAESAPAAGSIPGYQVAVRVSDGVGGADTQAIVVNITDADEFDPVIENEPITASVAETVLSGTIIATVTALEADLNGAVSYAITAGNDDGLFAIDTTTGIITLAAGKVLDAETASSHMLEVTASESDGPGTDVTTVAITVTDVDEFDPLIENEPITASVAETVLSGTIIATVTALEADLNGSVSYAITAGNDDGLFAIDTTTGIITLAPGKALDAETASSHMLEVTASESDGPGTDVTTVAITVDDVSPEILRGTTASDVLNGGSDVDWILGLGGNDLLHGAGNNDVLVGGEGSDRLFGEDGNDTVRGSEGHDWSYGDSGDDLVYGDAGNDRLYGGIGNDFLSGGAGNDWLYGGSNDDTLRAGNDHDRLHGEAGNDLLYGDAGNDLVFGGAGNDVLNGGDGNDRLFGEDGNDTLRGDAGNDFLSGGLGRDILFGGTGADDFIFNDVAEIGLGGTRDIIKDFEQGLDDIDLRGIDANGGAAGDAAFTFLVVAGSAFTGALGQLRWFQQSGRTIVEGDIDGDASAEFQIELTGSKALTTGDFLL